MYRLETPEAELKMFLSGMDGIRNERVQRREAGMELSGRKSMDEGGHAEA